MSKSKLNKNILQQVFGGNSPCYFTQVMQRLTDVHGKKVAGDVVVHTPKLARKLACRWHGYFRAFNQVIFRTD